jgi:hypothetical protein
VKKGANLVMDYGGRRSTADDLDSGLIFAERIQYPRFEIS